MKLFLGCVFLHFVLVQWFSPWWVPNLTLVGALLGICLQPARWWMYGLAAGWALTFWSTRHPQWLVGCFLVIGALVALGSRQWNLSDGRVQMGAMACAMAFFAAVILWIDHIAFWPIAFNVLIWWSVSVLAVPLVREVGKACRVYPN